MAKKTWFVSWRWRDRGGKVAYVDEVGYLPETDSPDVKSESIVCYCESVRRSCVGFARKTYILGRSSPSLEYQ